MQAAGDLVKSFLVSQRQGAAASVPTAAEYQKGRRHLHKTDNEVESSKIGKTALALGNAPAVKRFIGRVFLWDYLMSIS